jgi:hypothetical protein
MGTQHRHEERVENENTLTLALRSLLQLEQEGVHDTVTQPMPGPKTTEGVR